MYVYTEWTMSAHKQTHRLLHRQDAIIIIIIIIDIPRKYFASSVHCYQQKNPTAPQNIAFILYNIQIYFSTQMLFEFMRCWFRIRHSRDAQQLQQRYFNVQLPFFLGLFFSSTHMSAGDVNRNTIVSRHVLSKYALDRRTQNVSIVFIPILHFRNGPA